MHVYHFGAYEPATIKRLSGRYATRETELDTILRAELFVDLHTIVRHSLRASVESYSIKELERFYGLDREQDLRAATLSRHAVEWAIEMHEELPIDAAHALGDGTPERAARPQLELALGAEPEAGNAAGADAAAMSSCRTPSGTAASSASDVSPSTSRPSSATTAKTASRRGSCATGSSGCARRRSTSTASTCPARSSRAASRARTSRLRPERRSA